MSWRRTYFSFLFISLLCHTESFAQNWQPVSEEQFSGQKVVSTLLEDTAINGLYVGGGFDDIGGNSSLRSIALWKDGQWNALGNGLNNYQWSASLNNMTIYNGDLYVGGILTDADGIVCNGIARWNGNSWFEVANGLTRGDGAAGFVSGLRVIENELYACGGFVRAGGLTVNGLAKWNGTSWSDVHAFPFFDAEGDGIKDCIVYNDELYVVGDFNGGTANGMLGIAKWNGSQWVGVGDIGSGHATCMTIYKGKLYVAGYFTTEMNPIYPGNHIASWDGSNWDDVGGGLGSPVGPVYDMTIHNDRLYAVGSFMTAGGIPAVGIAAWDGTQWCDLETVANNGLFAIESFQDTVYIGGGPVSLNGSELMSIAKSGGPAQNENCGTLAGVDDMETENVQLTLHPNPTTSTTTLTWQAQNHGSYQFQLYDGHGRQVLHHSGTTTTGKNTQTIDMGTYAKGIYFGRLVVGGEMHRTFKVVRK